MTHRESTTTRRYQWGSTVVDVFLGFSNILGTNGRPSYPGLDLRTMERTGAAKLTTTYGAIAVDHLGGSNQCMQAPLSHN